MTYRNDTHQKMNWVKVKVEHEQKKQQPHFLISSVIFSYAHKRIGRLIEMLYASKNKSSLTC